MSNPRLVNVVAGCVIRKDGKYLLVQEKLLKAYGLWNLPAGHVDENETVKQAAAREAKEETGLEVRVGDLVCLRPGSATRPEAHAFKAEISGGVVIVPEDEILDAKWFNFEEIEALNKNGKLRALWVYEAVMAVEQK